MQQKKVKMRLINLLTTTLLLPTLISASERPCYNPNGEVSPGDMPCGSGTNVSCCNDGGVCMSNGLCMAVEIQPYTMYRASCTDKTWTSPECPNYCLQQAGFNASGCSIPLFSYVNDQALYCCNNIISNNGNPACDANLPTFTVPGAVLISGYAALEGYGKMNSSSTNTTSNNSTNDSTNNSTTTCPPNNNTSSDNSSPATNCTTSQGSNNNGVAVGAGVGIPLGLVALASIAWALLERRRRNDGYTRDTSSWLGTDTQKLYRNKPVAAVYQSSAPSDNNSVNLGTYPSKLQPQITPIRSEMSSSSGPVELDVHKFQTGRN